MPVLETSAAPIHCEIETGNAVDLLVRYLEAEGVEYIFGIPGGPLMPLYEAIFKRGRIQPILAKHEEGAAFMADGYARVKGGLGVCCATAGPGATNTMTGIAVSYADGIPVLLITAQVATSAFGRDAVQDSSPFGVDVVDTFKPLTKASVMLLRADKMGEVVRHLLRVAGSGRPGPVHLNIPADVAKQKSPMDVPYLLAQPRGTNSHFDRQSIRKAAECLLRAKRPAILAGNGINLSGAYEELRSLSEKLLIPVITTAKAKGVFPEDHVLSMGVFGWAGSPRAENYLLSGEVDVLLAVGTSLGEDATGGWDARLAPRDALIQVDIDPRQMGKNYRVAVPVVGDAKTVLTELGYQIGREAQWLRDSRRSLDPILEFRKLHSRYVDEEKLDSEAIPLKPQRMMRDLMEAMPKDAIIFCDMGNVMSWCFHYLQITQPRSFFHCLGFASMGHGTAAAIGAKLAAPERPVIAVVGDAAFAMNGMEVHTAAENHIPVVWLVQNNGGHGMVYHGEKIQFGGRFHNSLFNKPLDICKLGESLGALSFRVTRPGELVEVLGQALRSGRPSVVDVVVDPEEMPPIGARFKSLDQFFLKEMQRPGSSE